MSKFIAIVTQNKILAKCFKQTLSVACGVPVKCYHQYQEVIADILTEQVAGIIAIGGLGNREAKTESIIRHDLKNMPGWDYQKAEEYALPQIVDFAQPVQLPEIIHAMEELIQEEPPTSDPAPESFNLIEALIELRSQMTVPSQMISVAVIDDQRKEVTGIMRILANWPNIHIVDYSGVQIPWADSIAAQVMQEKPEPNIVLLDEDIGDRVKAVDVYSNIHSNRGHYEQMPIVVSITGGQTPDWATHHFSDKTKIENDRESAEKFVMFMNHLISNLPQS